MKSTASKIIIVLICLVFALVGFLIKLPVPFRAHDKFWHAAFYFAAAAFLHLLFRKGLILILLVLYLFGVLIEYLQPLTNKITRTRIHGRFDIEDVYANGKGLLLYLVIALIFFLFQRIFKSSRTNQ